jgi:hypothetical protein
LRGVPRCDALPPPPPPFAARHVAQSELRKLDTRTGQTLEAHKLLRYATLGEERVLFQSKELRDMKVVSADAKGLTLLGFKPIDAINP